MERFSLYEKDEILEIIYRHLKIRNIQTQYFDSYI